MTALSDARTVLHSDDMYVDGRWVPVVDPERVEVRNPATGEVITNLALAGPGDVDTAVVAARRAFAGWSATTPAQRVEVLQRVLAAYEDRLDDLADVLSQEMGAPTRLAHGPQVLAGVGHLKNTISYLADFEFEVDRGDTRIVHEPIGVVGMITPWNWPLHQILCKVAPALATGCTMVLKPSEVAPLNAIIFTEVIDAAGVPAGVFNLLQGSGPVVGEALAAHPDIDLISFTGSTRAGIAAAAPTVKRVTQELGGKSPNILLDDVDLEAVIPAAVAASYINSGQSCNAPTRLLVPQALHDRAVQIAAATARDVVVGDPADAKTDLGPVVNERQYDRVQSLIDAGVSAGATLAEGGPGRPDGLQSGWYVRPTVFSNVSNDMAIARDEIFGPVLSILPYTDEDEAVAIANDSDYGLAAYVSSADIDRARKVGSRLRAGQVTLNGATHDSTAPFGGYKKSGNGRELGTAGMHDFLETKALIGYASS